LNTVSGKQKEKIMESFEKLYDRIKKRAQEWKDRMTEEMQLVKEVALEHEDVGKFWNFLQYKV
jgi:molybdopterin synthase catalytic subunit